MIKDDHLNGKGLKLSQLHMRCPEKKEHDISRGWKLNEILDSGMFFV